MDDLLQGLTDGDSLEELRNPLATIPDDLNDLYSRILGRINPQYLNETFCLIEIIRSARGIVTLLDLTMIDELSSTLEVKGFQDDHEEIRDVCEKMKRRQS